MGVGEVCVWILRMRRGEARWERLDLGYLCGLAWICASDCDISSSSVEWKGRRAAPDGGAGLQSSSCLIKDSTRWRIWPLSRYACRETPWEHRTGLKLWESCEFYTVVSLNAGFLQLKVSCVFILSSQILTPWPVLCVWLETLFSRLCTIFCCPPPPHLTHFGLLCTIV